ncbi:MAG: flagellar motor protein MotB [Alphaproteobacteria bacterium]
MFDEPEISAPPPPAISIGWITSFSDLVALMLAFFVMLYSVSSRDPSRVEAAVSSVTEKFAKSSVISEFGTVASQTGVVVKDQDYLDSVISTIRGRDTLGEFKLLRNSGGALMVRLKRENIFVSRTGVLSPEGVLLAQDIAKAMLRRDATVALPVIELRIIATPGEIADEAANKDREPPVFIRQAGRFARSLIDEKVSPRSISTIVLEGEAPMLDMAFYLLSDTGNPDAATGRVE